MKRNPETLTQAMAYADLMEACASYVAVKRPKIKEPSAVFNLMAPLIRQAKQESIYIILLDSKSNVIDSPREITRGLLDSAQMHPREIFKPAIMESAAAIVMVHNHPSGDPTPSQEDINTTRRLVEASRIIGIPVFDHVIIGESYISLRERNLVSFTTTNP